MYFFYKLVDIFGIPLTSGNNVGIDDNSWIIYLRKQNPQSARGSVDYILMK